MWGSFKENVQSRFSSRSSLQNQVETTQQYVTKDAMKNVVTPQSIPQFIVPPLDPGELIKPKDLFQSGGASQSPPNNENSTTLFSHASTLNRAGKVLLSQNFLLKIIAQNRLG